MRFTAALLILGAAAGCTTASSPTPLKEAPMARLDYIELPATEVSATRKFYEQAFGWSMTEFAPTYAATTTGDTDIGLQADSAEAPKAPLPVIQVADLEAALAAVERAGGTIVRPIYPFPGGRRFHFRDPSGNQLAVWQAAAD